MAEFRLPLNGELGQFLKRVRKANHLTQRELSGLSGVSESEIARIERNQRSPNVHIAGRLEEALGEVNRMCPRCGGNLFTEHTGEARGFENWCLQCGYREDLKGKPIWKSRFIGGQIATSRV